MLKKNNYENFAQWKQLKKPKKNHSEKSLHILFLIQQGTLANFSRDAPIKVHFPYIMYKRVNVIKQKTPLSLGSSVFSIQTT